MNIFLSPQTGSPYNVILHDKQRDIYICYRYVNHSDIRLRLQVPELEAGKILTKIVQVHKWGEIKDFDHYSITVSNNSSFANAVGDVMRAYYLAYELNK